MDREKVIKALEICVGETDFSVCVEEECPYIGGSKNGCCITNLERDVLALLKEQEAVKPRIEKETTFFGFPDEKEQFYDEYYCGACGHKIGVNSRYCSKCGRKVKWE